MYKTSWYYQSDDVDSIETHCKEFTDWLEDKLNKYDVIDWRIQKDFIDEYLGSSYHVWILIMNCKD